MKLYKEQHDCFELVDNLSEEYKLSACEAFAMRIAISQAFSTIEYIIEQKTRVEK